MQGPDYVLLNFLYEFLKYLHIQQACSSVGFEVALFEVLQDIDDPKQYNLLRKLSSISDILHSWRTRQLKYVKVVIPIYPRAANGDHSAKTILKSIASPNIVTENDKKIPSDSLHRGRNGGAEISGSLVASLEVMNIFLKFTTYRMPKCKY